MEQQSQVMIPRALAQALAAYLKGRPWEEVNALMSGLMKDSREVKVVEQASQEERRPAEL